MRKDALSIARDALPLIAGTIAGMGVSVAVFFVADLTLPISDDKWWFRIALACVALIAYVIVVVFTFLSMMRYVAERIQSASDKNATSFKVAISKQLCHRAEG